MVAKTITRVFLLLTAVIFWSCDQSFDENTEELIDYNVKVNSQVIKVYPNGLDDTQNIKDAFEDAKLLGDGTTVHLGAGTFYISEPIVITDFNGIFTGAGKGLTILEDLPNSVFPLIDSGPLERQSGFIIFYLETADIGNLTISDMTINVNGLVEDWFFHELLFNSHWGLRVHGKVNGIENFESSVMNVSVANVGFIGDESPSFFPSGFNLDIALLISGEFLLEDTGDNFNYKSVEPISGNIGVSNCTFKNNRLAIDIPGTANADIVIGGNGSEKNIIDNVEGAISLWDESGSNIKVSHNRVMNIRSWGVWAEQGFDAYFGGYLPQLGIPNLANVLIEHNDFSTDLWGIIISDVTNAFGDGKSLDAVISYNNLTMKNPWSGGIFGWDSDEVFISNNKFKGQGEAGVYFGLWGGPGHDDWTIMGNNFNQFQAGVGSIWLGSDSNSCTVVGGNNSANCLDEGTNNVLTGVSNQGNPPGPEISAAIQQRRDLIKELRH